MRHICLIATLLALASSALADPTAAPGWTLSAVPIELAAPSGIRFPCTRRLALTDLATGRVVEHPQDGAVHSRP